MKKRQIDIAMGHIKPELVLKNASYVNVFSEEILQGDIAIDKGVICAIGEYTGVEEIDLSGKIVLPGLIDAHLHLESTMVHPKYLLEEAALKGTTTFIVDPHEAANVMGHDGIGFILDATEDAQANVYVMAPSCVPATKRDVSGAYLPASELERYVKNDRILGLGEMMDIDGILGGDEDLLARVDLFSIKNVDGHCGFLKDRELQAYVTAGIETDHECTDFQTAKEELRAGMMILIREGSAARNLEAIVGGIVEENYPTDRFAFCTDDKHLAEIRAQGHISYNVKKAIELGLNPMKAIKMATIQPAKNYGLKRLGAIAPNYQADLVVVDNLKDFTVEKVFYRGNIIQRKSEAFKKIDETMLHSVNIKPFGAKDIELVVKEKLPIIEIIPEQLLTKEVYETLPEKEGLFLPNEKYNKLVNFERHFASGDIGVGVLKGLDLKGGAIASSVAHDSHNVIVVGDNDQDILLAAQAVQQLQGGFVLVKEGRVEESVPLQILGLMSTEQPDVIEKKLNHLLKLSHQMGVPEEIDPLITLSFLSLSVIPEIRLTPKGILRARGDYETD